VYLSYISYQVLSQEWQDGYLLFSGSRLPDALLKTLRDKMQQQSELVLYLAAFSAAEPDQPLSNVNAQLTESSRLLQRQLQDGLSIGEERIAYQFIGPFHSEPLTENSHWFRLFLFKP
jgi:hypothetical protein